MTIVTISCQLFHSTLNRFHLYSPTLALAFAITTLWKRLDYLLRRIGSAQSRQTDTFAACWLFEAPSCSIMLWVLWSGRRRCRICLQPDQAVFVLGCIQVRYGNKQTPACSPTRSLTVFCVRAKPLAGYCVISWLACSPVCSASLATHKLWDVISIPFEVWTTIELLLAAYKFAENDLRWLILRQKTNSRGHNCSVEVNFSLCAVQVCQKHEHYSVSVTPILV